MRERFFAILCALNLAMCTLDFESFEFSNSIGTGGSATGMGGSSSSMGGAGGLFVGCTDVSDCNTMATDCITPVCNAGQCGTELAQVGSACADDGGAVCAPDGSCVECVQDGDCPGEATCRGLSCVGFACDDTVLNGDETDVDCGGDTCDPCADGQMCNVAGDCVSGFCESGTCAPCTTTADCTTASTWCDAGVCSPQQVDGEPCGVADSCLSGFCADGFCCDTACSGVCEGCSMMLTGAMDGVCTPYALFDDPEMECPMGEHCQGDGTCGTCGLGVTPVGGSCPAECTGGCNNDVCVIDCNAQNGCKSDTITCPAGFDCEVQCGGQQGCDGAAITCPADHECNVACSAQQACRDATVACSTNGPCHLSCSNDNQVCNNTTFTCGDNLCEATCAGNSTPAVGCGTSCSCTSC